MKQLSIILALLFALVSPAVAAKGQGKKDQGQKHGKMAKVIKKADANGNHQIESGEVATLQASLKGKALKKLDKNSNGQLDPDEIAKLNKKLAQKPDAKKGKGDKADKKGKKDKKDKKGEKKGKKGGKKKNK